MHNIYECDFLSGLKYQHLVYKSLIQTLPDRKIPTFKRLMELKFRI